MSMLQQSEVVDSSIRGPAPEGSTKEPPPADTVESTAPLETIAIRRAKDSALSLASPTSNPAPVNDSWSTAAWIGSLESMARILSESVLQPISASGTPPCEMAQLEYVRSLGREPEAVGKAAMLQLLLRSPLLVRVADSDQPSLERSLRLLRAHRMHASFSRPSLPH